MSVVAESSHRSTSPPASEPCIRIRGARVHNLRNLDLDIPRRKFVVITGPSGSGKSSLAFDTLYAEGQRQYIESLSVYARQFLHQLERPDVDLIEGLQPTLCIDQRSGNQNPRSTVATVTEIYDYLRLLLARVGEAACYQCGSPIRQQTTEQIQDRLLQLPEGTKTMILAPLIRGRRGQHKEVITQIRKAGFVRARVDGQVYELEQIPELSSRKMHHIDAVVDRIIIRPGIRSRIADSIQLAVRHGEGLMVACFLAGDKKNTNGHWKDELFSTRYACAKCQISYEELEPRTFSFNSPYGACPDCEGLGAMMQFDPELVIPRLDRSIADGAIVPWETCTPAARRKAVAQLDRFLESQQLSADQPMQSWTDAQRDKLFQGDRRAKYTGLLNLLEKEYVTTTRQKRLTQMEAFRGHVVCPTCHGSRLRPEANSVRLAGKTIHDIVRMPIATADEYFGAVELDEEAALIGNPLIREIRHRLHFLQHVGVPYLSLDRPADSLSGGEMQRVRLATSIGSGLVGVCYVLDEPSIGLHPRDNQKLIDALRQLQQQGNTIVVVEHDEAMMRQSDWLIDMGPGAGGGGGQVVAAGTPDQVAGVEGSVTGRYLSGATGIEVPAKRRRLAKSRSLVIDGVATNNLKSVTARFPLGGLICVTGVSGSGKSSLVNETLAPALLRRLNGGTAKPGPHTSLRGANHIDKVIQIDQSPIGRTPRSNAATYSGVFDEIRKVFAGTRESKRRGYRSSRFSFNVKGGRCEQCQGQGVQKIEMSFLADLYVRCGDCGGQRFNRQTLQVRYRDKNVADVLAMPVDQAVEFFSNFSTIQRLLIGLQDVGLGYLPLGQPSTTLSGGEAQRVKLATELARVDSGKTLYLLDEPTTGLHFDDIRKLLAVLNQLVDRGNTVIVIEHNLDVIKCADWIIDLGPDGGAGGGQILACGTPEQLAAEADNVTGQFLARLL